MFLSLSGMISLCCFGGLPRFFFFPLSDAPAAYGSSQARDQIWAAALQPYPQLPQCWFLNPLCRGFLRVLFETCASHKMLYKKREYLYTSFFFLNEFIGHQVHSPLTLSSPSPPTPPTLCHCKQGHRSCFLAFLKPRGMVLLEDLTPRTAGWKNTRFLYCYTAEQFMHCMALGLPFCELCELLFSNLKYILPKFQ